MYRLLTHVGLIAAGIVFTLAASAPGQTTWYVDDDNCPGPGDGSPGNPFCSIQDAIGQAVDGDTVLVCPGTYREVIDYLGRGITVRSLDGAESTTIDAENVGIVVTCVFTDTPGPTEPIVLDGFTITGGIPGGDDLPGGMYVRSCDPLIVNCTFKSNIGNDGGGLTIAEGSPTVVGCTFHDNEASDGGAVEHRENSSAMLLNCLFFHNHANVGSNPYGGAIRNSDADLTLVNCTFFENAANLGGGAIANIRGHVSASNCVFWQDNPDEIVEIQEATTVLRYGCISGGWGGEGDGNISDDPQFVAANSNPPNLRLSQNSPCIDAGDTLAVPPGVYVDLSGWGRVCDDGRTIDTGVPAAFMRATVDMGTYEYFLVGDLDRDCDVDLADLAALLAQYGR